MMSKSLTVVQRPGAQRSASYRRDISLNLSVVFEREILAHYGSLNNGKLTN